MKQNSENQTKAEYSKTLIMNAFYSLMKKKPFQEISITEISEIAGVSRLTFYRNFESKEDVIFEYSDRNKRDFLEKVFKVKETPDFPFILNRCFLLRDSERESCIPVYRDSLLYPAFHRSWDRTFNDTQFFSHMTYTRKRVLVGGMYSILLELIEGKNKIDTTDATEAIMEIVYGKEKAREHLEHSRICGLK